MKKRIRKCDNCNIIHHRNTKLCDKCYRLTIKGFLTMRYRSMMVRTRDFDPIRPNYFGKKLLSKEIFYKWAQNNKQFLKLYNEYKESGYKFKLTPTVDRLDPEKHYILNNMEWVTHSENSRRARLTDKRYKK